ncbi:MAG: hypothetical protein KatS3mg106_192 [Gemmataceae bacterium]|nr:MAG: hypothetical protein KatS3mg106_192 [Gemmataceae bacterium]
MAAAAPPPGSAVQPVTSAADPLVASAADPLVASAADPTLLASGGPPGGFGGGPPGGMMRGMDPERLWEVLKQQTGSSGDTIDLSKLPESVRRMNRMMAERFGTEPLPESGIMTKEQFISFNQRNMQKMSGGIVMVGPGGGGFGGGPPPWGERNGERRERDSGGDRGGNGWGGFGGGPPPWAGGSSPWWGNNPDNPQDPRNRNRDGRSAQEEAKPVALRYGKLPNGLPDWFESDDTNKDGQVSLYEWIKAGKSMEEFLEMDLNRDGLLTADELLRYRRLKDEEARITAIMEGTPPSLAGGGSFRWRARWTRRRASLWRFPPRSQLPRRNRP